jgi:hypothetical protein
MAQIADLGTLKQVDVREVWANEAYDFTPWLAQNVGKLGEALGMELELKGQEAPVGDFSLDLLAHDLGRDRVVIIENQLESTNHDHLGKLLTYAAGYDAGVIIWIAKEIREEHRQTVDWLNQHTDGNIEFYAVVIEVIQIDNSRPACNFKAVAFPNEWRKSAIASSDGTPTSERGEAYRAFFQGLLDELRDKHHFTGARAAQPQSWYSFASGYSGLTYGFSFNQKAKVRAELYIDRGSAEENKAIFDRLFSERTLIEGEFGEPLQWDRLDNKRAARIYISRDGSIENDTQSLVEIRSWGINYLLRLKKVFGPKLLPLAN